MRLDGCTRVTKTATDKWVHVEVPWSAVQEVLLARLKEAGVIPDLEDGDYVEVVVPSHFVEDVNDDVELNPKDVVLRVSVNWKTSKESVG